MIETETPTPTSTDTPTVTPTPTSTFTPTPNVYIEVTLEAGYYPARIAREATAGDLVNSTLLFAILVSLWVMFFIWRWKGGK